MLSSSSKTVGPLYEMIKGSSFNGLILTSTDTSENRLPSFARRVNVAIEGPKISSAIAETINSLP